MCVCVILLAHAARPARAGAPVELTLLAFNMHLGGVGPGGEGAIVTYFFTHVLKMLALHPSPARLFQALNKTAELIDDMNADVVVLNEFSPWGMLAPYSKRDADSHPEKNSISYLLRRLNTSLRRRTDGTQWKAHFTRYSRNWAGLFGNLLLYRTGGAITGEPQFHESYFKTKGTLTWKERIFFEPLDRHYVTAVVPLRGLRILVAGTHLEDHQDQHNVVVRRKAVQQMMSEIADRRATMGNPPAFVLGDLNALPPAYYQGAFDAEVIARFQHDRPGPPGADPIQKNTLQLLEEELRNSYVWKHGGLDAGAWTQPVTRPRYPLDYIYVTPTSDSTRIEVLRAFVPPRAEILKAISDHLPVVATVRITPKSSGEPARRPAEVRSGARARSAGPAPGPARGRMGETTSRSEASTWRQDIDAFDRELARRRESYAAAHVDLSTRPGVKRYLAHLFDVDQYARRYTQTPWQHGYGATDDEKLFFDEFVPRLREIDAASRDALKKLLDRWGWFKRSEWGDEADNQAWLLAQHADTDVPFQKRVLAILESLVSTGGTRPQHYAYLHDRVAVNEKRLQRFGT